MFSKENKGVTLIALVLTIIVLIILASISITALRGDNGIIKQSKDAKLETKIASVEEARDIWRTRKEDKSYNKTYVDIANELEQKKVITTEEADELRKNGSVKIGDKEIGFEYSLKLLYNIGADGDVVVPIDYGDDFTVDWGDGTTSIDNYHCYSADKFNTDVTIKIFGKLSIIDSGEICNFNTPAEDNDDTSIRDAELRGKLKEVIDWGDTGATEIYLDNCPNLTKYAMPNKNSFKNVVNFGIGEHYSYSDYYGSRGLFANTGITEILPGMFDNAPNVKNFQYAFYNTKITSIPDHLFDKCNKVENFIATFGDCNSLAGEVPKLWLRCSDNINYKSHDPNGYFCFPDTVNITTNIPAYWTSCEM